MDFPTIFEFIRTGAFIDEINYQYFCSEAGGDDGTRMFKDSRLDSLSISSTAGDIVNVSMNVFSKTIESPGGSAEQYDAPEKLITWDKVELSVNDMNIDSSLVQSFELEIKNNVKPIFTASPDNDTNDLGPHDLRVGSQEVTGTLSVYGMDGVDFLADCGGGGADPAAPSTIGLKIGGGAVLDVTITCVFFPRSTDGKTSAIVSSIPFMGVDYALGE
jgi:hypothetical protein